MISKRKLKHFLYKDRCINIFGKNVKFDVLDFCMPILFILLLIDLVFIGIWIGDNIF